MKISITNFINHIDNTFVRCVQPYRIYTLLEVNVMNGALEKKSLKSRLFFRFDILTGYMKSLDLRLLLYFP